MIRAEQVTWGVDGRTIVHGADLTVDDGEVVGLVGPNGCGKSSLLRCLVGLRRPDAGTALLDGEDLHAWPARRRARHLAFVEQVVELSEDLTVADVVGLGRAPHVGRWRGLGSADHAVVDEAMARVDITHLAARGWGEVSGGERQRAQLARAFAQQAPHIVLDEPTNHLDVRHQLDLMEQLRASGAAVLVSLHDLGLAARYCDRLVLMHDGHVVADGTPQTVLTPELIRRGFGVRAEVEPRQGTWAVSFAPG